MSKDDIRNLICRHVPKPGLLETALPGVQFFRVTQPMPCVPAVYDPTLVAIASGSKEAVVDGQHHVYDDSRYLLCPMTLPVKAGTPNASPDRPLIGVTVALDPRIMRDIVIDMDGVTGPAHQPLSTPALALSSWEPEFADALLRLLQVLENPTDLAVLGPGRLKELYYAVLKGQAGAAARHAFGAGNKIARTIDYLSKHLKEPISIDDLAAHAGMSRAVFHRRFKEATALTPIQFVKSMRLNNAAMNIAAGASVNQAAWDTGYISPSQFSREFKRMYGRTPRQWGQDALVPPGVI